MTEGRFHMENINILNFIGHIIIGSGNSVIS